MKLSPYQSWGALVILWFCGLCCRSSSVIAQSIDQAKHPYASDKPLGEPTLFGEGVISTGDFDSHPAFTPDGRTLYFVRSAPSFNHWTILVSRFGNGKWSEPEVAFFSGQYSDADPFITPDGSRFYFISDRPVAGEAKSDTDIWMMNKTANGWSEPKNLGAPVNSETNEWYPTVAANGTIYFGSERAGGKGGSDLYRCRLTNGKYEAAENLGDMINTASNKFEGFIAPDENYLIFVAAGHPEGRGGLDLYFTYQRDGKWTKPVNWATRSTQSPMSTRRRFRRTGNTFSGQVNEASQISRWIGVLTIRS